MDLTKIGVIVALLIVIGVPFAFRPKEAVVPSNAEELIVITPHNEQIRYEFARAFSDWHEEHHGTPVHIDWRVPGGTSEIRKQLEAMYAAAYEDGRIDDQGNMVPPHTMSFDMMFGGGSYDHGKLVRHTVRTLDAATDTMKEVAVPISAPIDFDQAYLDAIYGENDLGGGDLYHPDRFWFGTAVSAFGIVYNRDVLEHIGITEEPRVWSDLTDYSYFGWIALADPARSGSITTTYDAILRRKGWQEGWQVLRRCAANSRYFAASSSKVPIDVSQGEAAAGMCIDFYGRYQSQAVLDAAPDPDAPGADRIGYVDPIELTQIDADPISMLRGAPHPELARRFVEFILTDEAQALWQFARTDEGMGPRKFELRRMPVRRAMYEQYLPRFRDHVEPFKHAKPFENTDRNVRGMISILFSSMAIDIHADLQAAWQAISEEPDDQVRAAMIELFDAMPVHITAVELDGPDGPLPSGSEIDVGVQSNLGLIQLDLKSSRKRPDEVRIAYTDFFRTNYRRIVAMSTR
jgi:iron(III) transport system substrate-binding protein